MEVWSKSFTLLLSLVSLCQAKESNFLLTLPKALYAGSTSEFCLTLYDNATVTFSFRSLKNDVDSVTVEDNYTSGLQKCNKFQVPAEGQYNLALTGESDEPTLLHNSTKITVHQSKLITFVQTDKPMYKPGQKVMFRVFTLMRSLKPRISNIKSIFILDPNEIRVKQFLDVESKGIGSFEFQLIEEAKLGTWKIKVYLDDEDEVRDRATVGEFEVKEYVLPRFEVTVTVPKFILSTDEELKGKVCAQYTYGKPVSGSLHIELVSSMIMYHALPGEHQEQVVQISGCYEFTFNISKNRSRYYAYYINANVTEYGTGVTVQNVQSGPQIASEPLKIEMEDFSKGFFKPGIPYIGKVKVKKIDGSPAVGEPIKLKALENGDIQFIGEFVTDSDGAIVYSLCDGMTNNKSSIQLIAEAVNYNGSPRSYRHLQQWYSPSLSYIQIPQIETSLKCGNKLALDIMFTTKENTTVQFYYQVIARGKQVKSGQVTYNGAQRDSNTSPQNDKCLKPLSEEDKKDATEQRQTWFRQDTPYFYPYQEHSNADLQEEIVASEFLADILANFALDLNVSTDMSPKFSLLVYHVLPDGEVVADGRQFDVEPCFDNQVKMTFSEATVVPGDKVDIKINAEAESVCGIGVVDKSVNILGGNHQVTSEMIFKKIDDINAGSSSNYDFDDDYCKKRLKKNNQEYEFMWFYSSPFVDAAQAFEASGFRVITNLKVETRPCSRNAHVFYDHIPAEPVAIMGSLGNNVLTAYRNSVDENIVLGSENKIARSHFPETWLWDLHLVDGTGEAVLHHTAPHTITSWVGNVLCVHEQKGFGVSPLTSLRTFQPFFLSLQLPYAAVRGEKLPIMFTVYNYLQKCLHIQLILDVEKNFVIDKNEALKEPVCVCGGASYTAKIYVTPKATGQLPLTAKAEIIPGLCGNSVDISTDYIGLSDTVKRQMFVKSEGIEQTYTSTMFMCSKDGNPKQEELILSIPNDEEIVKDSAKAEVKVIGDIMGSALTNLDHLVRLPTGCGEQNMVGFVPNIFALKYLMETGGITDEIKSKALKHMEIGYQRELTFRHKDGSYSAFGGNDARGSIWLTAFVVKSYAQAQPYIYIDERDLHISLNYLHYNQLETGCYRETGKVFSSYMMGGLDKNEESFTALSAYVVIALLTAGVNSTEPGVFGAMECINKDFDKLKETMDPYTLALVAYANSLYSPFSHTTSDVITALEAIARKDGEFKYWARKEFKPKVSNSWYSYSVPSAEVEMTAYVLLAYIKLYGPKAVEKTHNIAMWLSKQRNPYGGFSSTQDTVVGLNALSEYARLAFSEGKTELEVSITGVNLKQTFSLSQKRKTTLLLQRTAIPVMPNQISVKSEGEGCALVQFSVFYNKLSKEFKDKSSFHLEVTATHYQPNRDKCDHRTIIIRVGTKGKQKESSGMAMVDIKLVTGWAPVPESLAKIKYRFVDIKKVEYNENEGVVSIYFDELSRKPIEMTLDVKQERETAVSNPKPADVKVYYYYETGVFVVQSYRIKTTCGTKQEIPFTFPEPQDGLAGPVQVRINPAIETFPVNSQSDTCPPCITLPLLPKTFKELVCNSSAAYKVVLLKAKTFKLLQDLRPTNIEKKINTVVNYQLPSGCTCSLLNNQGKKVILLVQSKITALTSPVQLDNSSLIITDHRKVTRTIRDYQKTCPLKKSGGEKKKKQEKS